MGNRFWIAEYFGTPTFVTINAFAWAAAVESGEQTLEEIQSFLLSGLSALMPEEGREFRLGGPVWVVRPIP